MIDFNPLDTAHIADPYPMYARLRREQPLFWHDGLQSWILSRYDDCEHVLRSSRSFARDWRRVGQDMPDHRISIQNLDPPDHGPLHSVFMAALRAQAVDELCRRAADSAHANVTRAADESEFEVVGQFAVPFALDLMAAFLGVRLPDFEEFADVSQAVMRAMDGGLRPEAAEAGVVAREALTTMVEGWYQDGEELGGALGHVRQATNGSSIDPRHVRNTARVMFQGGYSTLVAAVGNLVHLMAARPDIQDRMRRMSITELGSAVDEILRYDGPVQGTTRVATSDIPFREGTIPSGQNALCLLGSANRDERRFAGADELDLGRRHNRHMAFGWGAHTCIASVLARSALVETARVLLADGRRIALSGPALRRDTATLRAFDHLTIRSGRGVLAVAP